MSGDSEVASKKRPTLTSKNEYTQTKVFPPIPLATGTGAGVLEVFRPVISLPSEFFLLPVVSLLYEQ